MEYTFCQKNPTTPQKPEYPKPPIEEPKVQGPEDPSQIPEEAGEVDRPSQKDRDPDTRKTGRENIETDNEEEPEVSKLYREILPPETRIT